MTASLQRRDMYSLCIVYEGDWNILDVSMCAADFIARTRLFVLASIRDPEPRRDSSGCEIKHILIEGVWIVV